MNINWLHWDNGLLAVVFFVVVCFRVYEALDKRERIELRRLSAFNATISSTLACIHGAFFLGFPVDAAWFDLGYYLIAVLLLTRTLTEFIMRRKK